MFSFMKPHRKCFHGIPYCNLGIGLGVTVGLLDCLGAWSLGFEVTYKGAPCPWMQMGWHVATWSGIFYLLARFLEQRQMAQDSKAVIEDQYQKLVSSQNQLLRSAKLAALGELAASIAHEIRNPLGIIRSSAALLEEEFPEGDSNRKACGFITGEIDRLNGLITSLLRFARAKEPVFQLTSINDILGRSAHFVGSELRKRNVDLVTQFHPDLPLVTADEDQIYQAVLELFLNASRAMTGGGKIVASTAPSTNGDNQGVLIRISDTGSGIAPEDAERIWDPFFTTRSEGTGLGLSVVKQIVERHQGEIRAESEPGRGTTFEIRLPGNLPQEALAAAS